ncbi:MAG: DUF1947 domain-containing protein [Pyrodictiaceae archaeon]
MRRWFLSKKEKKNILQLINKRFPDLDITRFAERNLEYYVEDDIKLLIMDRRPSFIILEENDVIPHLMFLLQTDFKSWLPYVVIDNGAVKPISRGAALMRPGILEVSKKFAKDDIIVIVEPTKLLPLAVHRALYDYQTILAMKKGRVTDPIHHIGDRYWKIGERIR